MDSTEIAKSWSKPRLSLGTGNRGNRQWDDVPRKSPG